MSIRRSTRRKILELGETLLQRRGFNAFSYHHISKELGIRNAAIHYHFPSKEDLGLEVIERTRERFNKWVNNPEHRLLPVTAQLQWFVKIYQYHLEQDNRVCLIGSLATDYYTLPASMQSAIRQLSQEIQLWMARLLEKGRERGELQFEGRSQDKALAIISSLAGSVQLARLLGNDHYYRVVDQIYVELNLTL